VQIAYLSPPVFLWTWITLQCLHLALVAWDLFGRTHKRKKANRISLLAAIPSVVTLILFIVVFVIGHASTDAQLTPRSTTELWRLWVFSYLFNLLLLPVAIISAFVNLFNRPRPAQSLPSFIGRVAGVVASCFALIALLRFMPTA